MLLKKILLITYHFPPSAASGAFRLLGLARHLPDAGWQPLVVAPPTLPWEPIDARLVEQVPAEAIVRYVPYPARAPRLLRKLAQNAIWLPRAWSACRQLVRAERPDAILTSGPPHCVHVLGHSLKRSTGLPWVADFRDPWISDGTTKRLSWMQRWGRAWEQRVFAHADLILANAPNASRMLQQAYPSASAKIIALTNGFDPRPHGADISVCQSPQMARRPTHALRLLHAGEIYAGRNPAPLLEALARLNAAGSSHRLQVLGRCDGIDLHALLQKRGWTDLVQSEGQRSYEETLDALGLADILVLFDSPGRRIGVPAKLYEYLGAGRPILALAEPDGDAAAILRSSGVLHRIAPPTDSTRIAQAVTELAAAPGNGTDPTLLHPFTRAALAHCLARRLDTLIGAGSDLAARDTESLDALQEAQR